MNRRPLVGHLGIAEGELTAAFGSLDDSVTPTMNLAAEVLALLRFLGLDDDYIAALVEDPSGALILKRAARFAATADPERQEAAGQLLRLASRPGVPDALMVLQRHLAPTELDWISTIF
jgi:hypothetical protein